jgi:hypothetical protein
MAKPRIFVSSTYYDLRHIRNSLEAFIEQLGFEAVLFESGDIAFRHDAPLDESCYAEIHSCHILALIIGGRYGSPSSENQPESDSGIREKAYQIYNSITKREYETARTKDIPIYVFVEKNVLAEYQTYKSNRQNTSIKWAHVDSTNIFRLLDDIFAQQRNNLVKDFENFADISSYLRDQWAGLFEDFLSRKSTEAALQDLSTQVNGLSQVSEVLKKYTESIMRKVEPKESERIIASADERLRFQRMIESFAQEPLIRFIQKHTTKTPADLLKLLETSNSLSHFLEKANVLDPATLDVSNSESAQHDYQNILRRYFTQNTEDRGLDSREENDKQESKRRRPTSKARKTQIN